jgi:transposase
MRRHGSPQELERVRREAAALHAQGVSCAQIAAALDRAERTVQGWVAKAAKSGVEALAAKPHAGAKPKLTGRQRQSLRRQLLKGAEAHGFDTDLWTAPRVQELLGRLYGVEYHVHYVPELLKALGFSRQRPVRRAREQNEDEVQKWLARDWPRIKKKPLAAGRRSSSGMKAAF